MGKDGMTPEGERIFRELDKLGKMVVKVGFQHGEAAEENGADVCDVAAFNELGTENIKPRPFMKMSIEDNEDELSAFMTRLVQEVIKGKSAEQALKEIGVKEKALMQETIVNGSFEPNMESTIRRKGSDKPLIDTGRMRQSVNYVIKEKGK